MGELLNFCFGVFEILFDLLDFVGEGGEFFEDYFIFAVAVIFAWVFIIVDGISEEVRCLSVLVVFFWGRNFVGFVENGVLII